MIEKILLNQRMKQIKFQCNNTKRFLGNSGQNHVNHVYILSLYCCYFTTCRMNRSYEYHASFSDREDQRDLNQESHLSQKIRYCQSIPSRICIDDCDLMNNWNTFEHISSMDSKSCTRYYPCRHHSEISPNCSPFLNLNRINFRYHASQKCSEIEAN